MSSDLGPGQIDAYLHRLGRSVRPGPTLEALGDLHEAHLLTVPFENLDIHLGAPIRLELSALFEKVVERLRGGYCYELNGLFAALLSALGYQVELLSARVARPDRTFSPDFDHLALRVLSPLLPEPQLADVGFGDGFLRPLPLRSGFTRREGEKTLHLSEGQGGTWTYAEDRGQGPLPHYAFTLAPRALEEFEPRNAWQQRSPESAFTRQWLCSRATPQGRVTLSGTRLVETSEGIRRETPLEPAEVPAVLRERFGIVLA
ncbi:MAG TPA: arylamine N-acetyltransferase [Anaeromyxobacter sp.]|nr:arylamine N-acetyltransferase [Anaeromyxobacter sp.]